MTKTAKRILSVLLSALMLAFPLSSCSGEQTPVPGSDLAAASKMPTGAKADKRFLRAVTDFSQDLFRKSAVKGENLILSPLSVTYALTMTANGAYGDTLREFNKLNGGIPLAEMNEYLFWNAVCLESTRQSRVKVANSVWADNGFPINSQFRWVAQKYYNADAQNADFSDYATADLINQWVSDKTDGMIDKVLEGAPSDRVMMLINTILFDGKWKTAYEESDVKKGTFRNYDGTESNAEMLHSYEHTYFTGKGYEGMSKEYLDGYRFVAILPDEGTDVYDFAAKLDWSDTVADAMKARGEAYCSIPKFEYESDIPLNEILHSMGLQKAFTPEADFTGLAEGGERNLFISSVKQKAKIILNESGTKAAAYTEVDMTESEKPTLTFNRPFVYAIVDGENNLPIFMGILAELS